MDSVQVFPAEVYLIVVVFPLIQYYSPDYRIVLTRFLTPNLKAYSIQTTNNFLAFRTKDGSVHAFDEGATGSVGGRALACDTAAH